MIVIHVKKYKQAKDLFFFFSPAILYLSDDWCKPDLSAHRCGDRSNSVRPGSNLNTIILANTLTQIPKMMCFMWVTETEYIPLQIYLHITCRLSNLALTHSASNCVPWLGIWQWARKTNLNTSCQKEAFWAPYNILMRFCFTALLLYRKKIDELRQVIMMVFYFACLIAALLVLDLLCL